MLTEASSTTAGECEHFVKRKYRKAFSGSLTKCMYVGHLHTDTECKVRITSVNGKKYFFNIVNALSWFVSTAPLKKKIDVTGIVLKYVWWLERQSGVPVSSLHADNGIEFEKAIDLLSNMGIDTSTTTAYTTQSIDLAKRFHEVLISNAWTVLHQVKLLQTYWYYALAHVTACKNMLPHLKTKSIGYFRLLGNQSEQLQYIPPFGCRMLYRPVQERLDTFKPQIL